VDLPAATVEAVSSATKPALTTKIPSAVELTTESASKTTLEAASVICAGVVETMTIVAIARVTIETMEPWTSATKDATHKPFRTVVAVGCARVWIIVVVAVGADWCWSVVGRPYSDAHHNSLGVRIRSGEQANSKQTKKS
jgi:hypothetical protein